jgi:colanic acid biosynthesis glycosyl transferase WcaI
MTGDGGRRILVHDYAGHPFQVQLSRELARRGHEVLHLHFGDFQTPKGPLASCPDDPETFTVEGLGIGEPFQKYRFARRLIQERRYGSVLARRIRAFAPDVVVSANSPLDAQEAARAASHRTGALFVFWIQDVYSVAVERTLRRRAPLIGPLVARRFTRLEQRTLRASDAVVAITADFVPILTRWGVAAERITVIENWAPLDDIRPSAKDNGWSRMHGLADKRVLMYSGTLGLKHDPGVFLALATGLADNADVRVVVISEGLGADWLRERSADHPNLVLLPFQPFEAMSRVLASGDILVAVLEPEAGVFSVPSKVLSYLAAGRPILGTMPADNLAARIVQRAAAGHIVAPGDTKGLVAAAQELVADPEACRVAGENARAYAEATFDLQRITDRFEAVMTPGSAAMPRSVPRSLADPLVGTRQ